MTVDQWQRLSAEKRSAARLFKAEGDSPFLAFAPKVQCPLDLEDVSKDTVIKL